MQHSRAKTIWVDVEDFFQYFVANPRPSGIQRLAFEIGQALVESASRERVRFVRHARRGPGLVEVAWSEIVSIYDRPPPPEPDRAQPDTSAARRLQTAHLINSLPQHLRAPLFRAGVLHTQAGRSWRELRRAVHRRQAPPSAPEPPASAGAADLAPVQPGDLYLVLGAPWTVPNYAELLAELKRRYRLVAYLLVYDLIPVRHPEWCTKAAVALFTTWLDASLPLFDGLMAISRHTAHDVEAYAEERGLALPGPVRPIPIGTGFTGQPGGGGSRPPGLPTPDRYVLFVSTLEARKNHALAVRVWRKLEDEVRAGRRPAGWLPELVFAGRVGWLISDVLQQLDNMRWLGGRIRLLRDPTDVELGALYEGCLFTFFPSWFEGWGLPVSESLGFGKPCLASSATALPEAGGALCRYFDPGDTGAAVRAVADLLDHPDALAAWQLQVRQEFRTTRWAETAESVLTCLAAPELVPAS